MKVNCLISIILLLELFIVFNSFQPPITVWLRYFCCVIQEMDMKYPPWFNGNIKLLFNEKVRTYNAYRKNVDNIQLRNNLISLQQRLCDLIDDSKQKYFLRLTQ